MRITTWASVAMVLFVASLSESKPKPDPKPSAAQEPPSVSKRGPSTETVAGKSSVPGLTVSVEAQGEASWKMSIGNNTDGMITIVWDESTFVAGDGKSWGRLVPSNTRMLDIEKPHAPAPLAPHAALDEVVMPESRVALSSFGYDWRQGLNGGRLYLTLQVGNEKKAWTATVTESDMTSLGWWCWSSEIEGKKDGPKCSRTRDQCNEDRVPVLRLAHLGLKVTECASHAGSAWCLVARRSDSSRLSACWDNEEQCRKMASDSAHRKTVIEVECTERP